MKWLLSPLSVLAAILFVVLGALWYFIFRHDAHLSLGFYVGVGCIPVFLLAAFILSKVRLIDEWKVGVQVALVIAPLITLVQTRDPERQQTFVMIVPYKYTGPLQINFVELKKPYDKLNVDTVYFRFDDHGKITLSQPYKMMREAMEGHCCYIEPDHSLLPLRFYPNRHLLPTDTTRVVLMQDTVIDKNGRITQLKYFVDKPQHLR